MAVTWLTTQEIELGCIISERDRARSDLMAITSTSESYKDTIAGLEVQLNMLEQTRNEEATTSASRIAALEQENAAMNRRLTDESTKSYEMAAVEARLVGASATLCLMSRLASEIESKKQLETLYLSADASVVLFLLRILTDLQGAKGVNGCRECSADSTSVGNEDQCP
jgi:hypothetical protein